MEDEDADQFSRASSPSFNHGGNGGNEECTGTETTSDPTQGLEQTATAGIERSTSSSTLRGLLSLASGASTRSKTKTRNVKPGQDSGVQTGSSLGPPSSHPSSVHGGNRPIGLTDQDPNTFFIESAKLELNGNN